MSDYTYQDSFEELRAKYLRKLLGWDEKQSHLPIPHFMSLRREMDDSAIENAFRYGIKSILAMNRRNDISSEEMELFLSLFLSLFVQAKVNLLVNNGLNSMVDKLIAVMEK